MNGLIENRSEDINSFFKTAGFPYEFVIKKNGENKASTYLNPVGLKNKNVVKPENHLSWGEKNAFSLIMFLFDAVSENADLIILDDPISSFDNNKKFAVIKRMFKTNEVSFRNNTVLMLTHDMQPIIDYVHGSFFKRDNISVNADYIENINGIISEKQINYDDLKNVVGLTKEFATNDKEPIHLRVINLRKYVELTKPHFADENSYKLLSNIIHGRVTPLENSKDNSEKMSETEINDGMNYILEFIKNETYDSLIEETRISKLIESMNSNNSYSNILAIRLLLERNEGLLNELMRKHPGACKFLNETNHIENDYVFQLDPKKYFKIPENFKNNIIDFINSDSELLKKDKSL